ncbi:MAG: hypothetical protein IKQ86_02440 [Prevotella sp.]|jgi:hypothetical protein|nr:hypothetical protein [Prevotella sp.]
MNNSIQDIRWSENVILVDADYVDKVAFNLIVNFERMLGRRIPQADITRWIDCVALDGGIREGEHETQVILLHSAKKSQLDNFNPGKFEELSGKAFKDHLGEFLINAYPVEDIVGSEQHFCDMLQLVSSQKEVKRVIVIPDSEQEHIYNKVRATLKQVDEEKRITLLAMQPMANWNFRQEILGYSLLAALGISSDEINSKS